MQTVITLISAALAGWFGYMTGYLTGQRETIQRVYLKRDCEEVMPNANGSAIPTVVPHVGAGAASAENTQPTEVWEDRGVTFFCKDQS